LRIGHFIRRKVKPGADACGVTDAQDACPARSAGLIFGVGALPLAEFGAGVRRLSGLGLLFTRTRRYRTSPKTQLLSPILPAQRLAQNLCSLAAESARRGDYATATRQLDEAERLAGELAQVHHYRSNVAILQDQPDIAIASLERALEIEPDNALFARNLAELRRRQ
jgi:tetratricopeptide (TPR) repeat protein